MAEPESIRVDKWLWSVRAYKTRTQATDAAASGAVLVNGTPAKPATKITVGDEVTARRRERTIIYEVVKIIEKRVSAGEAAACVVDHSPPPEPRHTLDPMFAYRDPGTGRPTKRDRRLTERLQGRR